MTRKTGEMKMNEDGRADGLALPPTRLGSGDKNAQFWLRALKVAGGEETLRYEATLMRGVDAVARVSNDGHGGECGVYPQGEVRVDDMLAELSRAADETLNPIQMGKGKTVPWGWCGGLCALAGNTHLVKKMKRQAKKNTLFLLPGESLQEGYRMVKGVDPGAAEWIEGKHPGSTILNDLLKAVDA